eukprot:CAMPEP_0113934530 /NCGR_PEP_ID=MMETSP1339-20121228/1858_1 /TAXON_ID=94617 /ORGANISM="Fibrocapsa japonica" /LENGTH=302 /DNA_ID=CAMNT_0000936381 /DNA_START=137 /DNA_END=1042 /DNA_ORIENTATION=+ /assembly_acc=CAM_ASM_000762
MQCHALFLSDEKVECNNENSSPCDEMICVRPFISGELDESVTKCYEITVSTLPLPTAAPSLLAEQLSNGLQHQTDEDSEISEYDDELTTMFATKGLALVKLQYYLHPMNNFRSHSACGDDLIRVGVERFWRSAQGLAFLRARFHYNLDPKQNVHVLPTHVTRRKAPPDEMSLVHIDYPQSHGLLDLTTEWWSRWKNIFSQHELVLSHDKLDQVKEDGKEGVEIDAQGFCRLFDLIGVVTTWICLQPNGGKIDNHPLVVADASTVCQNDMNIYKVGNRHSVGITFNEKMQWFHAPGMVEGDAW